MLIANPIYDTVFKYLMQNIDIARGIISAIIGEEIVHLDFKTRESIYKSENDEEKSLTIYYLDFIAKIKKKDGCYKNVLIELQKTNISYDIMRFRRYVGEQYKKEDEVPQEDGTVVKETLPIITIYILGFYISRTLPAVIKVNRKYVDLLCGKEIHEQNDFIERLTHDSIVIQIPALQLQMKNRLEYILSIFKQEKFIDDYHRLKNYDYETNDELMDIILHQLGKAAADRELLQQLELEELAMREYENAVGDLEKKLQQKDRVIKEKEQALERKEQALNESRKAIEDKDKYIKELLEKLKNQ